MESVKDNRSTRKINFSLIKNTYPEVIHLTNRQPGEFQLSADPSNFNSSVRIVVFLQNENTSFQIIGSLNSTKKQRQQRKTDH